MYVWGSGWFTIIFNFYHIKIASLCLELFIYHPFSCLNKSYTIFLSYFALKLLPFFDNFCYVWLVKSKSHSFMFIDAWWEVTLALLDVSVTVLVGTHSQWYSGMWIIFSWYRSGLTWISLLVLHLIYITAKYGFMVDGGTILVNNPNWIDGDVT